MSINCQRDYLEENAVQSRYSIKKLNHQQISENNKVVNKIANYKTLIQKEESIYGNLQTKLLHFDEFNFTIDTDNVKLLIDNETGKKSYNFPLIRDNPLNDNVENLVLFLNNQNEFDVFIVTYGFTKDEYKNIDQDTFTSFSTKYVPIDFDTSIFNSDDFEANGLKQFTLPHIICIET